MRSVLVSPRHVPRRGRLLALTGLLAVTALMAVPPLGAAAATSFGSNLVKNPGAENGLTNWDTFLDFQFKKYSNAGPGFPSKSEGNRISGGGYFFYSGLWDTSNGACPDAQQEFKLKGIGSAIDSGHVKVRLQGQIATNGASDLYAHLDLYFRDSNNHSVASNGITKKVTETNQHFRKIDVTKTLSKHTRTLRIHLWADGSGAESSGDCAAFWDKLSVVLIHS